MGSIDPNYYNIRLMAMSDYEAAMKSVKSAFELRQSLAKQMLEVRPVDTTDYTQIIDYINERIRKALFL